MYIFSLNPESIKYAELALEMVVIYMQICEIHWQITVSQMLADLDGNWQSLWIGLEGAVLWQGQKYI